MSGGETNITGGVVMENSNTTRRTVNKLANQIMIEDIVSTLSSGEKSVATNNTVVYGRVEESDISGGKGSDTLTVNSAPGSVYVYGDRVTFASIMQSTENISVFSGLAESKGLLRELAPQLLNELSRTEELQENKTDRADRLTVKSAKFAAVVGGGGNDIIHVQAVSGVVLGGSGDDTITITGNGGDPYETTAERKEFEKQNRLAPNSGFANVMSISGGTGDDTVDLTGRTGGVMIVDMKDGDDTLKLGGAKSDYKLGEKDEQGNPVLLRVDEYGTVRQKVVLYGFAAGDSVKFSDNQEITAPSTPLAETGIGAYLGKR